MKLETGPASCISLFHPPLWHSSQGHCWRQFLKNCVGVNMVYSRAWRVFILNRIESNRNRLVLFVKPLAVRILTRQYRIRQEYTVW
jgi:hypothetical protein